MQPPSLRHSHLGILLRIHHILIGTQKVIIILTEHIRTIANIQTPLGPVQISHKPEHRPCDRTVLVVAFGLMSHDAHVQGAGVATVRGLALPYLVYDGNVAEGNGLVGGEVDGAPVVL